MNSDHYGNTSSVQRELMTSYYDLQASVYDFTRWMFLFGRTQIIRDLQLKPGDVVVEVGCGTGRNFSMIREAIGETGELIAVDCSYAMLEKARDRILARGWKNVRLIDSEYGWSTVTRGEADAVLFSYSLSMIPSWQSALNCAREELNRNGRVGIVDFCNLGDGRLSQLFAAWMIWNHVDVNRSYRAELSRHFRMHIKQLHSVLPGVWGYFRYIGQRDGSL